MNVRQARLAGWVVSAALISGIGPLTLHPGHQNPFFAQAQNLGQRNVSGSVLDNEAAPIVGATVFLKNLKTKSIRSYTTEQNGHFRFAQVTMTDDYDLWAEKDGKKSATKTVSSWDARKDFQTELKMK